MLPPKAAATKPLLSRVAVKNAARIIEPLLCSRKRQFEFSTLKMRARLARRGALRGRVDGVQRLAAGHEEPIALGPAEADVAADLRQRIRPMSLPSGFHTVTPL